MDHIQPNLSKSGLIAVHQIEVCDHHGKQTPIQVVGELPLTVIVDGKELVTLMTLGTHPEMLVLGYLKNQTLFDNLQDIESIVVDWSQNLAKVKTVSGKGIRMAFDNELRIVTTGCGQGTILSCTLDKLYDHRVEKKLIKQSEIFHVLKSISKCNTIYRKAGSVHACGLYCHQGGVLVFIEEVGRHNAIDTISGEMWLKKISGFGKILYTTGRLTSEIVMKSALMGISVLISRNGSTHMAYELAEELGVTLIIKAKSRQFKAINADNLIFDQMPDK